jgi:flagellum-specific peptidoglycan hydrolase FlgJ
MTTQALFLRLMMLLKETFSYCLTLLLLLQAAVLSAQTRLSADDYIIRYKDIAIEKMQQYHIPASITLAQGLLESGNGNSILAREANNHFGIKCHKEWTGKTCRGVL